MLKIRLARIGKKHEPHYRIVVTEARSKRNGKIVEQIGHWHPQEGKLIINQKLYGEWQEKGAIPSPSTRKIIESNK